MKGTRKLEQTITLPSGASSVDDVIVQVVGGYALSVAAGYSTHTFSGAGGTSPQLKVSFNLMTERTDNVDVTVKITYFYK